MNKTPTTTNLKNIRFSFRLGHWAFSPGWASTLAVLLLLPLLLSLGCWQWHRAAAKQQLLDQFASRSQQPPQPLAGDEPIYTPVQVTGHYDNAHPILLDNRIVNHQVGYDVLIPFVPADGKPAVLVNKGWIPRSGYSEFSSSLNPARDDERIIGLVQIPGHNLVLAHPKAELRWPLIIEDIRTNELSQVLNRPLYPFILLLSGDSGFAHHWEIVASVGPDRHRGYAVQWFGLALTLLILYFKLNIHRKISKQNDCSEV